MIKKYQVFVSSTYTDLIEERKEATQALLETGCIPAGMELFPASNKKQWDIIKRVIDDCDYYLLIIGGRYGSLGINDSEHKIGFTEMEFDYAVQAKKPIIAFIHDRLENLPLQKSEKSNAGRHRLERFRKKVQKDHMVRFWNNKDNLKSAILTSIPTLISDYPSGGWIKINSAGLSVERILKLCNENMGTFDTITDDYAQVMTGRVLNASQIIRFEANLNKNSQILLLASKFKLDSEEELIRAISINIQKGCYYYYAFSSIDRSAFVDVCSLWWKQFYKDLLTSLEDNSYVTDCAAEYEKLKEICRNSTAYNQIMHEAKSFFLKHIKVYNYKNEFPPISFIIYQNAISSKVIRFANWKCDNCSLLIPLPSKDGYYGYLFPGEEIADSEIMIKKATAFCQPKHRVRIEEDELQID